METAINILKAIFSKDVVFPFITTFLGAWLAFKYNRDQMEIIKKDEQIANLNYLIVTLHNYLKEMEFFRPCN